MEEASPKVEVLLADERLPKPPTPSKPVVRQPLPPILEDEFTNAGSSSSLESAERYFVRDDRVFDSSGIEVTDQLWIDGDLPCAAP